MNGNHLVVFSREVVPLFLKMGNLNMRRLVSIGHDSISESGFRHMDRITAYMKYLILSTYLHEKAPS